MTTVTRQIHFAFKGRRKRAVPTGAGTRGGRPTAAPTPRRAAFPGLPA
jgi:hypothetical protein